MRVAELSGQLADHRDPVAVGGQDPRAGYPAHLRLGRLVLVLLLRCTVPPLPATRQPVREASGAASVPELRLADKPYAIRKNEVTTFKPPGYRRK